MNDLKVAHIWWTGVGLVVLGTVADMFTLSINASDALLAIGGIAMASSALALAVRHMAEAH